MLYKQISVGTNHSCLSCHLHELSYELNNMRKRPAVLVLPGGGYHICADREAEPVALAYMAQGFQAFFFRYAVGSGVSLAAMQ